MSKAIFADPVLHHLYLKVVADHGELEPIVPLTPDRYFQDLAESIIGQQLSNKVAPIIRDRFTQLVGDPYLPAVILETDVEQMRAVGLSYAKASYVRNLAEAWEKQLVSPEKYSDWDEAAIIADLTKIKGIGRWTVEMFMIFGMGRVDVFSVGDFALRKAVMQAYDLPPTTKPTEILEITQHWQPHRSLASRVLWKSLEKIEK